MEIREIVTHEDRLRFKLLARYAYNDWRGTPIHDDELHYIIPGETIGVFKDTELISGLINNILLQSIRGVLKPLGAVGSIATYPEHRGQGLVNKLMIYTFHDMHQKNIPVTMLGPFKQSFYEKYDYVTANENQSLRIPLHAVTHYAKFKPDDGYRVIRYDYKEAKPLFTHFIEETVMPETHGFAFKTNMSDDFYQNRYQDSQFLFILKDEVPVAFARYTLNSAHLLNTIVIKDIYWKTYSAQKLLFNFFAKHKDQITHLNITLPFGYNFHHLIKDSMNQTEIHVEDTPWMVRIIDVKDALEGIPVSTDETIVIEVIDRYCEWNNDYYLLRTKDNTLQIENTSEKPDITIDIKGLSSLLYGIYSVDEISDHNWITIHNEDKAVILDTWFPKHIMYSTYEF